MPDQTKEPAAALALIVSTCENWPSELTVARADFDPPLSIPQ
jgi:hypothetical protein